MAESVRDGAPRYHRRVLTLGIMLALAVYVIGAPIFNNRIEDDLERRVPVELADAGFEGVTASFSGQDGTLLCDSPLADPEAALDAAYDVWGVRKIDIDRGCRVRTAPTVTTTLPADGDADADSDEGSDDGSDAPITSDASDFPTVADIVVGSPELSLLADLAQNSAVADQLAADGDITLFAPSDTAFDALPADVIADLRADPELLQQVLAHHVVDDRLEAADLSSGPLETIDGGVLDIDVGGSAITIDGATVTAPDMVAGNGVVHVIDQVLVPTGVNMSADPEPAPVQAMFDGASFGLTGVVATEVERAVLVDAAAAAVGIDAVDDRLTVDPDTGLDGATAADLAALIAAMPEQLVSGTAGFDGSDLFVNGRYATDEQRDAMLAVAESVQAEIDLESRPEATDDDAADLENDLNEFAAANPILFEPASAVLSESADSIITSIARRLVQFEGVSITVEGHTDSDGTPSANLALSQQRAAAVVSALTERGVDPAIVSAEGFGDQQPVLVDGVEDKEASRRVEFRVEATS